MNQIRVKLFSITLLVSAFLSAQTERDYLYNAYKNQHSESSIISKEDWKPYNLTIPGCFDNLSPAIRKSCIEKGESYLGKSWVSLPATLYMDYSITGNRDRFQTLYFERRKQLATLVISEVLENKGRFMNDILNGIWTTCEESSWCLPAHQRSKTSLPDPNDPVLDLFSGETASLIAWTHFLLKDKINAISSEVTDRMVFELEKRVLTPYLIRKDWGWMGFTGQKMVNNWNPWINSNVLVTALLTESDPQKRSAIIEKTIRSVDIFINRYPEDGGCDEGPSYWDRAAGAMFDYLELLKSASGGKITIYNEPLIKKMGQFVYKTWIAENYYMNFSDAGAKSNFKGTFIYRFGKSIQDPKMMSFGAYLFQRDLSNPIEIPGSGSMNRLIPDLMVVDTLAAITPKAPYTADVWLPNLEVAAARSNENSSDGLYFAALGGHNAQSHNHNDVGSLVVYSNGKPMLIDVGVGAYTAQTFSSKRYDIWTMQSRYHNLPTINGIQQKDGSEFKARQISFKATKKQVVFSMDIAGAYPKEAKVSRWIRTIKLDRNKKIELIEDYNLSSYSDTTTLNLMTACKIDILKPGLIELSDNTQTLKLGYDSNILEPRVEVIPIKDTRLNPIWGDKVFRIVFLVKSKKTSNRIVISIYESTKIGRKN